jgi:alpha-beta hydrolase superfamily lysophospholipase
MDVNTFDLRGHGRSGGKRGHTPSYEALMRDISDVLAPTTQKHPSVPCVLYGHSLGGNLVLNYGFSKPANVKAVVASSPWIKLAFAPPRSKVLMAKLLNMLLPSVTLHSKLDPSLLSRDPAVGKKYAQDTLVHDLISFRLYTEANSHGLYALENATSFPKPLFVFHGSKDQLVSAKASAEFAAKAGEKATLKIWEGLYHETHNEVEKQEVFDETIHWINRQIL